MKYKLIAVAVLIVSFSTVVLAQSGKEDMSKYKLLATTKTSTMQKELDEVSGQGYRIIVGSPTSGTEMAIFLSMEATAAEPYKYKLLATTRTGTMQKELNEAADGGYRLLARTMIAKAQLIGGVEIVMIMEKPPRVTKQYEYKLLATSRTGTLQKEVTEAQEAGFVIVGMVSRGEHMVVMERESNYLP
jgi:queuine/archaeosine tRNA-ribosyltransferase